MDNQTLIIRGLSKTYPSGVAALKDIDLDIQPGMFGLLGPNGSGKTTLMKVLATLLEPDSGTAQLNGVNLITDKAAARRLLGYLPQDFGLYPSLTAEEMLSYLAALKGIVGGKERRLLIEVLLERVNLAAERKQKLGTFSGGMRQRFGIAQALIGQPRLLIVDEPTAGLDPQERFRFHNLLMELADNVVVILSTHIVSDVANLCAQMAIIRRGRIIAAGTPAGAIGQIAGRVWETDIPRETATEMKARLNVISAQMFEGRVRLRILSEGGSPGPTFALAQPTLEDYYFSLVNRKSVEE